MTIKTILLPATLQFIAWSSGINIKVHQLKYSRHNNQHTNNTSNISYTITITLTPMLDLYKRIDKNNRISHTLCYHGFSAFAKKLFLLDPHAIIKINKYTFDTLESFLEHKHNTINNNCLCFTDNTQNTNF